MDYNYPNYIEILQKKGSVLGLDSMRCLLDELGHPERNLQIIHTAGTNGKGSTLAFLASILNESGYHVGRYISPTIICYEERFQIDGNYIKKEELEELYELIWKAIGVMEKKGHESPTLFEAETALAFLYFNKKKVDFVLLEVGMGGAEDATNVIESPLLSIITSISLDHMQFLGNTVEEIAAVKAGIIKKECPSLLSENEKMVQDTVNRLATKKNSVLTVVTDADYEILEETFLGSSFLYKKKEYHSALPGAHQIANAVTALTACDILRKTYPDLFHISEDQMKQGIAKTQWPGRLEVLEKAPILIRDGAHNPDAAIKLANYLEKHFTNKRIIYIMGVLSDKDYRKMLEILLPLGNRLYTFTPDNARGLSGEMLKQTAMSVTPIQTTVCHGVNEAVALAKKEAQKEDALILCGSLSFMAEMN